MTNLIHSKTCNKQRGTSGKCVCGHQHYINSQKTVNEIPTHIPADEVPIFNFMVKQGKRDSMSLHMDIKQMLNEISQIKAPLWQETPNVALGNNVVKCNHCDQTQIVKHCGTNGNHHFELAELQNELDQYKSANSFGKKALEDAHAEIGELQESLKVITVYYRTENKRLRDALKEIGYGDSTDEQAYLIAREALGGKE